MPHHTPIQLSDNRHCYHSSTILAFISLFALLISLVGYTSFSNAAPATASQGKSSSQAQDHGPVNTQGTVGWVKGRLLITPRAGLSAQELEKTLKPHRLKPKHHLKQLNVHICELPEGVDEVKVKRALKKDRRLKHVELDMIVAPDLFVTDPSFGNSWALPKIQAPTAWDIANGDGIIIAVLDTGVNSSHPDLAANMVPGWNMFDNNADTADVHGHGTMVAGTAAAAANNDAGSVGVSWGASIMPIRISDPDGFGYFSTIAAGIRWAADNGAKVVNNSYSGVAGSSTIQAAAEYLRSKGGVVVVSAGNTGGLLNYAASDSLLVASATGSSDLRPSWSSYGPYVDIAAPGVSIYTTTSSGGYGNASGTSFSSPVVAATAALMLSANNDLTPSEVDQLIKSTAVDLGASGFDDFYGAGRVDAAAAVAAASTLISTDDQSPTIAITSPTSGEVSGIVPVDVNYSDNVGVVRVELYVNGQKIITDSLAPFAFAWDSTSFADGDYTLSAQAFDAAGNQGNSTSVAITVNNSSATDSEAPAIEISSPLGGEVAGIVPVSVNYSDNVDVVRVDLYVNGQKTLTSSQAPFAFNWDTNALSDGGFTLTAHAFDEADNEGISSNVSVTVNNTPAEDTTAPVITGFNLTDGMKVRRRQTVSVSATDDQDVAQIILTIDGNEIAVSNSSSLSYKWNTRPRGTPRNTTFAVTVQVSDQAGNVTSKTVNVHN
jgi:subtilisin family serine protease